MLQLAMSGTSRSNGFWHYIFMYNLMEDSGVNSYYPSDLFLGTKPFHLAQNKMHM